MSALDRAAGLGFPSSRSLSSEMAATFALAWPLIATNLAAIGMTTTDVMMLGWLSPEALAGGSLGFNLYFPFFLFGVGVVGAVSPLAAHAYGADRADRASVRAIAQHGLIAALVIALPAWLVLWFAEPILTAIGEPPALTKIARVYVHGLQWALLPGLGYFVLRGAFAALDRVGPIFITALAAFLFNAAAAYGLIFGKFGLPALGVFGSGLATTSAQCFMALALIAYAHFDRGLKPYGLASLRFRLSLARLRRHWRLGLPMGLQLLAEVSIFAGSALAMGLLGPSSIEAHAVVLQIASLAFAVPLGIGQGAIVRVGQSFGARDHLGVARAGLAALVLTCAFAAGSATLMLTLPRLLLSAFFDVGAPSNAATIALAFVFLRVAAALHVFDGLQATLACMLRGLHDTRWPMILALVGYWGVGAPLGLMLAFLTPLAGVGLWLGLAAGLFVVAALLGLRWRQRLRAVRGTAA